MRIVRLLAEGETERAVADRLVIPAVTTDARHVQAIVTMTRRRGSAPADRGGVRSWKRLRQEIVRHLSDPSLDALTTMFDLYGFPADAPGMDRPPAPDPRTRVRDVELALADDISDDRFRPFLLLHELEAWVLAAIDASGSFRGRERVAQEVRKWIADCGGCAEFVDGGQDTAPSKRLKRLVPDYGKLVEGPSLLDAAGLVEIRRRCPHLDEWLNWMEAL